MAQPQEPSLLEYARFHGISINYLALNPIDSLNLIHPKSADATLWDDGELPEIEVDHAHQAVEQKVQREKLTILKDSAFLLSSAIKDVSPSSIPITYEDFLPSYHSVSRLILEPPLLKCEPALLGQHDLSLTTLKLPLEAVRDENDEGLVFPDYFWELPDEVWGELKNERIDCPREALLFLQETRKYVEEPLPEDIKREIFEMIPDYSQKKLEPISPLILSRSPPTPSATKTSPVIASMYPQNSLSSKSVRSSTRANSTPPFLPIIEKNPHAEGLVLCQVSREEPQFQPRPRHEAAENPHNISEEYDIESVLNGWVDISNPPKDEAYSTNVSRVQRDCDGGRAFLTTEHSDTVLESENLHSIEWRSRVWKEMSNLRKGQCFSSPGPLSRSQDLGSFRNCCFDDMWCLSKTKLKDLQWKSSPKSVATTYVQEIAAEGAFNNLLTNLHECENISGNDLPQEKNQGLHFVKLETLESNYTPMSDQRQDLGTPFDKNDSLLQCDNGYSTREKEKKKKKDKPLDTIGRRGGNYKGQTSGSAKNATQHGSSESSTFSSLGNLTSYMETRCKTSKRQKIHKSNYFAPPTPKGNLLEKNIIEETVNTFDGGEFPCDIVDTEACCPSFFCDFPPLNDCPIFIISTTLLKTDVQIIRDLESLKPVPILIFRDYEAFPNHESLMSQDFPTSSLSRLFNPIMEADIIVSPSTGIVITTSQEISQVRLPGHKPAHLSQCSFNSPLRERIARLANRYEQLYILIRFPWACGNDSAEKSKIATIDSKTLLSIQSLTAFCSSLSEYTTVALVMQSSCPHDTTKWILSITNKHAIRFKELIHSRRYDNISVSRNTDVQNIGYSSFSFLHEETQWELLLRHAGFNPFAAQTVLGILKLETEGSISDVGSLETPPKNEPNKGFFLSGLSLFIELCSQERHKMFANVVGQRVLRRVEGVIDKDWQLNWAISLDSDP